MQHCLGSVLSTEIRSLLPPYGERETTVQKIARDIWSFEQPMGYLTALIGNPFPYKGGSCTISIMLDFLFDEILLVFTGLVQRKMNAIGLKKSPPHHGCIRSCLQCFF